MHCTGKCTHTGMRAIVHDNKDSKEFHVHIATSYTLNCSVQLNPVWGDDHYCDYSVGVTMVAKHRNHPTIM